MFEIHAAGAQLPFECTQNFQNKDFSGVPNFVTFSKMGYESKNSPPKFEKSHPISRNHGISSSPKMLHGTGLFALQINGSVEIPVRFDGFGSRMLKIPMGGYVGGSKHHYWRGLGVVEDWKCHDIYPP